LAQLERTAVRGELLPRTKPTTRHGFQSCRQVVIGSPVAIADPLKFSSACSSLVKNTDVLRQARTSEARIYSRTARIALAKTKDTTMTRRLLVGLAGVALLVTPALANDYAAPLTELSKTQIAKFVEAPEIVAAIKAQNAITVAYDQAKIDTLDKEKRAEVGAADQPLISKTLATPASAYLKKVEADSKGLFTEIFVMDAKGLNVAQSGITSDYWQGDEPKWQQTFPRGKDAVHISDVDQDESTQTYQSQVSIPVVDPADGSVIGAVTVGVNVELLQ
jgi:hypothetical protein